MYAFYCRLNVHIYDSPRTVIRGPSAARSPTNPPAIPRSGEPAELIAAFSKNTTNPARWPSSFASSRLHTPNKARHHDHRNH